MRRLAKRPFQCLRNRLTFRRRRRRAGPQGAHPTAGDTLGRVDGRTEKHADGPTDGRTRAQKSVEGITHAGNILPPSSAAAELAGLHKLSAAAIGRSFDRERERERSKFPLRYQVRRADGHTQHSERAGRLPTRANRQCQMKSSEEKDDLVRREEIEQGEEGGRAKAKSVLQCSFVLVVKKSHCSPPPPPLPHPRRPIS